MLGVILSGGKSSRMGRDKGLLQTETNVWAKIAKEKLSEISLRSVVSINHAQHNEYSSHFKESEMVPDHSHLNVGGPLLGVLSVHLQFPDQDLFVLACDLAKMEITVLRELIMRYKKIKEAEAFVFKQHDQIEPLCGIYRASGLTKILAACHENRLIKQSMIHVLEQLGAHYLVPKEEWIPAFQNFNSPNDLQ